MVQVTFNRDPPSGFQGLRDDQPITFYQRRLPHWRQAGATYFVTFRLADSLPQGKLHELRAMKEEWLRRNPEPRTKQVWESYSRMIMTKAETWLDQGMGSCWLRRADCRRIVEESLLHFDQVKYELGCYVIMPNHVHAIIRPFDECEQALEKILQGIKGYTSRSINKALNRQGSLWREESFDRIIRDEEHLWKCAQYIGNNPRFANLDSTASARWVCASWCQGGWQFDDEER